MNNVIKRNINYESNKMMIKKVRQQGKEIKINVEVFEN